MSRVAILGCGPAGLLATHAAVTEGHEVSVFSIKKPSRISGAQYLHEPIPDLTPEEPDGILRYEKQGDAAGYAFKVYGDREAPCSWGEFPEGEQPAWSMRDAYEELWNRYVVAIRDTDVSSEDIVDLHGNFELVVSAMPARALCHRLGHQFRSRRVCFADEAEHEMDDTIMYNGDEDVPWYRSSRIFGFGSTEFPVPEPFSPLPGTNLYIGEKPLSTTCNCWKDLLRVGRFGKWTRGVLVHHAYEETLNALAQQ